MTSGRIKDADRDNGKRERLRSKRGGWWLSSKRGARARRACVRVFRYCFSRLAGGAGACSRFLQRECGNGNPLYNVIILEPAGDRREQRRQVEEKE